MAKNFAAIIPQAKAQLEVGERAIPTPGPTEILVKNSFVALNPVELAVQEAGMFISKYPNVQGSDIAGVVQAVGSDVTVVKPGDRVTGFAASLGTNNPDHGGFQNFTLIDEASTTKLPPGVSNEEAATLPMQVATAGHMLFAVLGLPRIAAGKRAAGGPEGLLVWGGASSVGVGAIQLAKALGFSTYVTASAHNHEYLRGLGADHLFDYKDAGVADAIVAAAKAAGERIRYGADCVSTGEPHSSVTSAQVLARASGGERAKLAATLPWPESAEKPEGVEVEMCLAMKLAVDHRETSAWLFNQYLSQALADGSFRCGPPPQRAGEGLGDVQAAYEMLRKGVSGRKLVIPIA